MFFISYIRYTSYSLCFNNLLHISMKNSFRFSAAPFGGGKEDRTPDP